MCSISRKTDRVLERTSCASYCCCKVLEPFVAPAVKGLQCSEWGWDRLRRYVIGRGKVHNTSSAGQHALVISSPWWANTNVASWGLKLRFSTAFSNEEVSASSCWPDQRWSREVQVSLYWVTSEAIVRLYILYLYRYLYHHHHHCIEWPLEDIVRSYITGNPPSREAFTSHWLPHFPPIS